MATTPPIPFDVKAISAYSARNGNELSLEVGRVYRVLATDGRGVWWQSKTEEGQVGWFPASYTQVVESAPPPAVPAQPEPVPVQEKVQAQPTTSYQQPAAAGQPQVQQQPAVSSMPSAQSQTQIAGSNGHTVPSERGPVTKTNADPMLSKPLKDPCTVVLHVVESTHSTLPSGKSPQVHIYKRGILEKDFKKMKPMFTLSNKAKAGPFKWGEEFKIYVKDAEMELITLRFNFKDYKSDSGFLGELEFPLRGAVRKFDKPNGIFQWWPIKKGNDKIGEALIFIEYCDPRPFSGPSDVQHKGHVGLTSAGGFEIRDIPQEWKQLFRVLNIKKKDLENNAEMAQEVMSIMQQAVKDGVLSGGAGSNEPAYQEETNNNYVEPVRNTPVTQAAAPPPPVPGSAGGGPKPPPPPAPPSVGAGGGGPKPPAPPPPVAAGGGPKPPAPPPPTSSGGGAGGPSLLEQIQRGTSLKPAQIKDVQTGSASTGNPLADTLLNAMSKYRVDIEGKDNDEDDWD